MVLLFFFFKQKTAYEMRISDWSSDVCSSDLIPGFDDDVSNQSPGERGDPFSGMALGDDRAAREAGDGRSAGAGDARGRGAGSEEPSGAQRADQPRLDRSEERRVGKKCVSTCRSRG